VLDLTGVDFGVFEICLFWKFEEKLGKFRKKIGKLKNLKEN
jgi:hypothetical protein